VDAQGHKVIGSAQLRRGPYLLQHGSLGLAPDTDLWQQVFQTPAPALTQAQAAMVNGVTVEQVIAALTQAAQDCFNCHLLPQPLTSAEWQALGAWAEANRICDRQANLSH
jgi:lipoate-protein ligase A